MRNNAVAAEVEPELVQNWNEPNHNGNGNGSVEVEVVPESFQAYMQRASKHELLTPEEEASLGKKVLAAYAATEQIEALQAPDTDEIRDPNQLAKLRRIKRLGESAGETLVASNLRLVVSVAKKHRHKGEQLVDVIQDGNIGLMRASEKFDPRKGYKFSTYATWWIRQSIDRGRSFNNNSNATRFPSHIELEMRKIDKALQELGIDPQHEKDEELHEQQSFISKVAAECELSEQRVTDLMRHRHTFVNSPSFDQPSGRDHDTSLGDMTADNSQKSPEAQVVTQIAAEELRSRIHRLEDKPRQVLQLRYGLDDGVERTLEEVSDMLNLSRERVRQIQNKSIKQLRRMYKSPVNEAS